MPPDFKCNAKQTHITSKNFIILLIDFEYRYFSLIDSCCEEEKLHLRRTSKPFIQSNLVRLKLRVNATKLGYIIWVIVDIRSAMFLLVNSNLIRNAMFNETEPTIFITARILKNKKKSSNSRDISVSLRLLRDLPKSHRLSYLQTRWHSGDCLTISN